MKDWLSQYNRLIAELKSKGVNVSDAVLIDKFPSCRAEVKEKGAIQLAEELCRLIDNL